MAFKNLQPGKMLNERHSVDKRNRTLETGFGNRYFSIKLYLLEY